MSEPFLGEIRTFSFGFTPRSWAQCNGQLMSISQNQALFSLLGTFYGGDGRTTFGLPNLQGRFPISFSANGTYPLGQTAGEANHTLTVNELPVHTHTPVAASSAASVATPATNYPAASAAGVDAYGAAATTTLGTGSSVAGGNQSHPNMPPYLVINYCIALAGIFPTRS